jgi:hypothetical protein
MSKYSPLRDHLASYPGERQELLMTFEQIEDLVGKLPRSAYVHRAWRSNTADAKVAARAWRLAGWYVKSIDRDNKQVVFARSFTEASRFTAQKILSEQSTVNSDDSVSEGGEPATGRPEAPSSTSFEEHARPSRALSRRALISDLLAAIVAGAAAGTGQLVGFTHLPWLVIILLSIAVAVVAFTITQAIMSRDSADGVKLWWSISTVLVLILSSSAFVYHEQFDPATRTPQTYQLVRAPAKSLLA